jgi:hypothetical protein
MLARSHNSKLYSDWLEHIRVKGTKDAFLFLVGYAACLTEYECHPQFKGKNGPVRDFRFLDSRGEQRFAFIVNNQWLLFYFRPPAIRSGQYTIEALENVFGEVSKNSQGAWAVKIRDIENARNLINLLQLK